MTKFQMKIAHPLLLLVSSVFYILYIVVTSLGHEAVEFLVVGVSLFLYAEIIDLKRRLK